MVKLLVIHLLETMVIQYLAGEVVNLFTGMDKLLDIFMSITFAIMVTEIIGMTEIMGMTEIIGITEITEIIGMTEIIEITEEALDTNVML